MGLAGFPRRGRGGAHQAFFFSGPDFCHVLGSSLTDKCVAVPSQTTDVASSHTAQLLQSLFPPLASSLRCLEACSPGNTGESPLAPRPGPSGGQPLAD